MSSSRCIKNTYPDYDEDTKLNKDEIIGKLQDQIDLNIKDFKKHFPPDSKKKLYSNGKKKTGHTMYTGTGGNVYLYYKLIQYSMHCGKSKWIDKYHQCFMDALNANISVITELNENGETDKKQAFLQSDNGVYTMAALYYHHLSNDEDKDEKRDYYINLVLDSSYRCFDDKYREDEILNGLAGYLYCLILFYDLLSDEHELNKNVSKTIEKVSVELYKSGKKLGEEYDILLYRWPRKDGKYYLGGAHGLIGVLYMLLQASLRNNSLSKNSDFSEDIKKTLNFLISIQFESGNFPSSYGKDEDRLLHFCHGAPGAIPLMLLSYELFQDEAYLESACKAGEIIWKRGLLLKGFGICHGISGNTLVLHSLYRATKDPKWEYRSYKFAESTTDSKVKDTVNEYDDKGRQVIGKPDTPYSLMEGMAGYTIMLIDMCMDDDSNIPGFSGQRFPAYEI